MARRTNKVLIKDVAWMLHAIGELVPRLEDEERSEVRDLLIAILEYLQLHYAEEQSDGFADVEAELREVFRRSSAPRARSHQAH